MSAPPVIWHDLECGSYAEDLPLWRELAARHGDPVLDLGAGTGRVALDLARAGHRVTALDRDAELLAALEDRGTGLPVETVLGDVREFALGRRFPLCLVPMQTIQLLADSAERLRCLRCVRTHLASGAIAAFAISEALEPFDPGPGVRLPLPDLRELDGVVYSSQPTAVRSGEGAYVLERRREIVQGDGHHSVDEDRIRLAALSSDQLEREGERAGLSPRPRHAIAATSDYVGSTVVMFGG
ncbi:MAG TPA: class I SAM-dependent methyltransferase [Solirubrobacteraceae bacterium]|nr:class I SAM-dependent methyltransferase [Solirubrobacteraceae bacterium]